MDLKDPMPAMLNNYEPKEKRSPYGHTHIVNQNHLSNFKNMVTFINSARAVRVGYVDSHVTELSKDGQIDRFIPRLIDGRNSLGEIARRLAAEFPARFAGENEARVGELSLEYGLPPDRRVTIVGGPPDRGHRRYPAKKRRPASPGGGSGPAGPGGEGGP
jgi:hypothetical protein